METTFTEIPVPPLPIKSKPWTREDELELLALVQLGLQTGETEECHSVYLAQGGLQNRTKVCMIGAAMVGKFGSGCEAYQQFRNIINSQGLRWHTEEEYMNSFSRALGINQNLLHTASYKHMAGVKIAEQLVALRHDCYN